MTRLNGFALALALTASASCSVQGFSVSTTAVNLERQMTGTEICLELYFGRMPRPAMR